MSHFLCTILRHIYCYVFWSSLYLLTCIKACFVTGLTYLFYMPIRKSNSAIYLCCQYRYTIAFFSKNNATQRKNECLPCLLTNQYQKASKCGSCTLVGRTFITSRAILDRKPAMQPHRVVIWNYPEFGIIVWGRFADKHVGVYVVRLGN